jgi:hypothetical protein
VSLGALTIIAMGSLIDLEAWRRTRQPAPPAKAEEGGVDRLERAMDRLSPLVSKTLDASGSVEPRVETELLAIMGELAIGLIAEAAGRAERLAGRLEGRKRAGKG